MRPQRDLSKRLQKLHSACLEDELHAELRLELPASHLLDLSAVAGLLLHLQLLTALAVRLVRLSE